VLGIGAGLCQGAPKMSGTKFGTEDMGYRASLAFSANIKCQSSNVKSNFEFSILKFICNLDFVIWILAANGSEARQR